MSSKQEQTLEDLGFKFHTPPGLLAEQFGAIGTPCTVTIPPNVSTITTSGHLGWGADGKFPTHLSEEIENVFKNIETSLKHAGASQGWRSVYSLQTFQSKSRVPDEDEFFGAILPIKAKYMGSVACVWTGVSVPELHAGAAVEIVVSAALAPLNSRL
ncbi:hypothetical protein H2198_003085 [Neophaeococcomyces mojaviensis]|uniref:Uncharacterized protein n=1 Tax=Neophaeococcomyces mojaviensis TaxID=3383035 RepID=A0ACC3ACU3_9EURO|nr:hypothetical protein H2198_003085 [Knufia sp. JES_112]